MAELTRTQAARVLTDLAGLIGEAIGEVTGDSDEFRAREKGVLACRMGADALGEVDRLSARVAELEPIVRGFLGDGHGAALTYGEWAELVEHARRAVGAATPAGDGYCGSRSQPHCGKWTVNDTGQWGPSRFVCTKPHGHDGAHHSGYSGWMWTDDDRSPRKDTSQPAADGTGGGDG